MKKYLILLLLLSVSLFANPQGCIWPRLSTSSFGYRMMLSYVAINNHSTFTQAQKDTITAILNTPSVVSTYGPAGQNKTVCDFFIYLRNTNVTTALTARNNIKTGATLNWWFDRTKAWDKWTQNNLPADTCKNGWVCIFSTDGFSRFTTFAINQNFFTENCPSLVYFTGVNTIFMFNNNSFSGNCPPLPSLSNIYSIQFNNNQFSGTIPSLTNCSNIISLYLNNNSFTGETPNIGGNKCIVIQFSTNSFTLNGASSSSFAKAATSYAILGCALPTIEVDELFHNMNIYFTTNAPTANHTVNTSGGTNGVPTGGVNNTDILALIALYTTAGKTFTATINI
jgi:hypothetical protein